MIIEVEARVHRTAEGKNGERDTTERTQCRKKYNTIHITGSIRHIKDRSGNSHKRTTTRNEDETVQKSSKEYINEMKLREKYTKFKRSKSTVKVQSAASDNSANRKNHKRHTESKIRNYKIKNNRTEK